MEDTTHNSPLIYVTSMLTVSDMLKLEQTCTYMKNDDTVWTWFYNEYKKRLTEYNKPQLDNLSVIFYGDKKRAIKAFKMREMLYWMSFKEQVEYLKSRRTILIYLISLWQRHGIKPIKDIVTGINRGRSWNAGDSIRWRVCCWEMVKGKSNRFFRRNYLPVY